MKIKPWMKVTLAVVGGATVAGVAGYYVGRMVRDREYAALLEQQRAAQAAYQASLQNVTSPPLQGTQEALTADRTAQDQAAKAALIAQDEAARSANVTVGGTANLGTVPNVDLAV
jgi:hypothetical protein